MPLEVLIQLSLGYDWRSLDDSLPEVVILPKKLFLLDCWASDQNTLCLIMPIITFIAISLSLKQPRSAGFAIDADIPRTNLLKHLEMLYVASVAGPLLLIAHIEIEYNQMEVFKKA